MDRFNNRTIQRNSKQDLGSRTKVDHLTFCGIKLNFPLSSITATCQQVFANQNKKQTIILYRQHRQRIPQIMCQYIGHSQTV